MNIHTGAPVHKLEDDDSYKRIKIVIYVRPWSARDEHQRRIIRILAGGNVDNLLISHPSRVLHRKPSHKPDSSLNLLITTYPYNLIPHPRHPFQHHHPHPQLHSSTIRTAMHRPLCHHIYVCMLNEKRSGYSTSQTPHGYISYGNSRVLVPIAVSRLGRLEMVLK